MIFPTPLRLAIRHRGKRLKQAQEASIDGNGPSRRDAAQESGESSDNRRNRQQRQNHSRSHRDAKAKNFRKIFGEWQR